MKLLPLTQGKFAIVDADDYVGLSKFKWYAYKSPYTYYAGRSVYLGKGKDNKYKIKNIRMHRQILNVKTGEYVDHRDGNGLNNTRENLRICTHSQNLGNQKPRKGGTSKYKGVSWDKTRKKWRAYIRFNYKGKHLGYYADEIEAARAYDKAAIKLFGEFACLNFSGQGFSVAKATAGYRRQGWRSGWH